MCYSVESSAKTSLLSLISIIILFTSNVPHFKWIAVMMISWCSMQVGELLLWLTNPSKSCTTMNKVITLTLIPLILLSQPIFSILGSFYVKPWSDYSKRNKMFIIGYCIIVSIVLLYYFFENPTSYCTTVTKQGHLNWIITNKETTKLEMPIGYYAWAAAIIFPAFLLWDVSYKILYVMTLLPLFGFIYGVTRDSKGGIWCYYSSYSAVAMLFVYGLYKSKIYNILK